MTERRALTHASAPAPAPVNRFGYDEGEIPEEPASLKALFAAIFGALFGKPL